MAVPAMVPARVTFVRAMLGSMETTVVVRNVRCTWDYLVEGIGAAVIATAPVLAMVFTAGMHVKSYAF